MATSLPGSKFAIKHIGDCFCLFHVCLVIEAAGRYQATQEFTSQENTNMRITRPSPESAQDPDLDVHRLMHTQAAWRMKHADEREGNSYSR